MGLAAVLSSDVGHFSTLGVVPGGLSLPRRGSNGGRTGQQGRKREDEC